MGQGKPMNILIYRPDKKIIEDPNVDCDCLYYPNGRKYAEPKQQDPKHPLEKIHEIKITNSFVEVGR